MMKIHEKKKEHYTSVSKKFLDLVKIENDADIDNSVRDGNGNIVIKRLTSLT